MRICPFQLTSCSGNLLPSGPLPTSLLRFVRTRYRLSVVIDALFARWYAEKFFLPAGCQDLTRAKLVVHAQRQSGSKFLLSLNLVAHLVCLGESENLAVLAGRV